MCNNDVYTAVSGLGGLGAGYLIIMVLLYCQSVWFLSLSFLIFSEFSIREVLLFLQDRIATDTLVVSNGEMGIPSGGNKSCLSFG